MQTIRKYAEKVNSNLDKVIPAAEFTRNRRTGSVHFNFDDRLDRSAPRTIVCLGAANGGTSVLPYALQRFGVPVGRVENERYEDGDLLRIRHSSARLQELIEKRNSAHDVWAFKVPSMRRGTLAFFEEKLRQPVFLHIYRNPLSVASSTMERQTRRGITQDREGFSIALDECHRSYAEFWAFMKQTKAPCLCLGLETLYARSEPCLAEIVELLGLSVPAEVLQEVATEIKLPGFKAVPA